MRTICFSCQSYEKPYLEEANQKQHFDIVYLDTHLDEKTVSLAKGYEIVSVFVTDNLNAAILETLYAGGTRFLALRTAGFNHVNIEKAKALGMHVARVPAYSPHAVAEFAVALILTLNRKILRANQHVHEFNFSLNGLMGFDLFGKTVGVIGTGKIGAVFAKIMQGFGCRVIAYDPIPNADCKVFVEYVSLNSLYEQSDIISLHCPLNEKTQHLIHAKAIETMKNNVMIINTGRGALLDTRAIVQGLKSKKIGYLGLDVYEEEEHLFFQDHSNEIINDDLFARLLTFPNVIITGHQAYFTREAVTNIAKTTILNIGQFEKNERSGNWIV